MNNLVSVRIQNKYKTSFSLSHYLKHSHSTISKKVRAYCLVNNLDYKKLKYEQEYQIIKSINKVNYFINENGTKTPFRRDITQEIYLLQRLGRTDEIEKLKEELKKLDDELFNPVNQKFKDEIKKVNDDYKTHNKRKLRCDAVINYSGIITFGNEESNLSREEMDSINQDKLDNKRTLLVKNILKDLGIPDNAYILTKHLDEQQIHYHFEFIGYDYNSHKLVRKQLTQKKLIKFQDLRGETFKELNFSRGKSKDKRVQEHCKLNNIDYKSLSPQEKYELLKEVGVKYESSKNHNAKINNELEKKQKKLNQIIEVEKTIEELYQKILNKELTLEQIKNLQEQNTDKRVKTFLSYRYRINNSKNSRESGEKTVNQLKETFNKMTSEQKNMTLKIKELQNNINSLESREQVFKDKINQEYKEKMNIIEKEKNNNNYQLKQNQEKEIEINENILFLQNLINEFNKLKEETLKAVDLKIAELYKETVIDKTIEIQRSNRLKYIQDLVKELGKPQQEVTPNIDDVDSSPKFR
ncbi:plasmid recombination protein [Aliarcobacter butzleri]|uniref:plasmid recombination protein n=1 Tax=Aliarcobacter butzleri TaxID=28197 RepID=UPI00263CD0E5|nr:plasmid recombination protein [Aliarcobacter butzleri]MDN5109394.1 plasmid recombination protein [Aliarcobacter butzleri]